MRQSGYRKWLLLCLMVALLLTGCSGKGGGPSVTPGPSPSQTAEDTVTFTDDLGRQVTVEKHPARTAALIGSFASVWTLSGGELVATADDAWTSFDLGMDESVVNLGKTRDLSLEKLLGAEPDFILASSKTQLDVDWMETFEKAGIPTAYFDVSTFDDYLRMLKICTEITGREDLYQEKGLDIQAQVDAAIARAPEQGPTVLYLRASAVSVKVKNSQRTVLGEMLKDMGCVNIADQDNSLLEQLSLEHIMAADPDYIFVVQQGQDVETIERNLKQQLLDQPAWRTLTAVKEGRIFYMDQQLYNLKPNDRWGEAYEKLADILYPA